MSEVIAGIIINNETLIFIDFDRPVWKNVNFPDNRCIPTLNYFVADGILGAASKENLESLGLSTKYIGSDFSGIESSVELDAARTKIYEHASIPIEYFHPNNSDIHIEKDLAKFSIKITSKQISESEFTKIIRPR
ncbi:hypothetical protein MCEMZLE22_01069 [actinobacterium SCGC AAA044-D11]